MLFKSEHITQASGSIAGVTYAHNRGGLYRRARTIPVDPASAAQVLNRGFLSDLANRWSATLTEAQREAWRSYALAVPLTGPLGTSRDIGGEAMYVRCNVPRLNAGLTRVDAAPAVLLEGEAVLSPVLTADSVGITDLSLAFTNPSAAVEAILIQQGRPQNAGVTYFKGPFLFAGSEAPPLTPAAITVAPFPFVSGQRIFVRARYTYTDGRLGPQSIVSDIAT